MPISNFRIVSVNSICLLISTALLLSGCSSFHPGGPVPTAFDPPRRTNTITGSALGGAAGGLLGAAIGANEGKTGEGALIGAIAGATTGGVIGNQADRAENQIRNQARQNQNMALQGAVTYQDIVAMSQSGLSDKIISNQIQANGMAFAPTTQELLHLKNSGISDSVISCVQAAFVAGQAHLPSRSVFQHYPETILVPSPVYHPSTPVFVPGRVPIYHPRRGRPHSQVGFHVDF